MAVVSDDKLRADDSRRKLGDDHDREARLHRRRKVAMRLLLEAFEQEIEPHITPGHEQAITNFKQSLRGKLNALTFEATELIKLQRGERFNEAAADLAEHAQFDANGGTTTP
jgi:hypothetical protein